MCKEFNKIVILYISN